MFRTFKNVVGVIYKESIQILKLITSKYITKTKTLSLNLPRTRRRGKYYWWGNPYAVICGWFGESVFPQTWHQSSDLTPKMAFWHLSQSENDNLAPHPSLKLEYPMPKAISIVSLHNLNYWHENYVYISNSLDAFKKKWVDQTPITVGTLLGWEQLRCFPAAVIWTGSVLVFLYNKQIFEILHIFFTE